MSDFGAISMLGPSQHAVAANDSECVRMYIEAGGSVNGHDFDANYEKLVAGLIKSGGLTMAQLDTAVGNVLRVKGRLGLIPIDGLPFQPLVSEDLVRMDLGPFVEPEPCCLRAFASLLCSCTIADHRRTSAGGYIARGQPRPRGHCASGFKGERGSLVQRPIQRQAGAAAERGVDQAGACPWAQRRRGSVWRLLCCRVSPHPPSVVYGTPVRVVVAVVVLTVVMAMCRPLQVGGRGAQRGRQH